MRRAPRALAPIRILLVAAFLGALLTSGLVPPLGPGAVRAGTAETMESQILGLVNQARVANGLVPVIRHGGLADLADYRAGIMASTGTLSHTVAGCISCQLGDRKIQYWSWAEDVGYTSYAWGDAAASNLFEAFKSSPSHWAALMSATYNYIGIGVAYRSADGTTWASILLTESVDQTRPWARMKSRGVSGTSVSWSWTGADTRLQSHTAGLYNFDVQYRVDSGAWTTIRSGTTSTSLTLTGRAHRHYYGLRVLSRDRRGIRSYWTAEMRVWVP